jgi:hypothetical protein
VRAALAVIGALAGTPVRGERLSVRIGIASDLVVIGVSIGEGEARQQTAWARHRPSRPVCKLSPCRTAPSSLKRRDPKSGHCLIWKTVARNGSPASLRPSVPGAWSAKAARQMYARARAHWPADRHPTRPDRRGGSPASWSSRRFDDGDEELPGRRAGVALPDCIPGRNLSLTMIRHYISNGFSFSSTRAPARQPRSCEGARSAVLVTRDCATIARSPCEQQLKIASRPRNRQQATVGRVNCRWFPAPQPS